MPDFGFGEEAESAHTGTPVGGAALPLTPEELARARAGGATGVDPDAGPAPAKPAPPGKR
jgi:hypothetical protein